MDISIPLGLARSKRRDILRWGWSRLGGRAWQWNDRRVFVPKRPQASAHDAEPAWTVRVGARDLGVGRHPVVRGRDALLRCEQGEHCA